MEEYRRIQQEKYNLYKQQEKEKLIQQQKQQEEIELKKYWDEQWNIWSNEGYSKSETQIIVDHLTLTFQQTKKHNIIYLHPAPPPQYKAIVKSIDDKYVQFDMRCLNNREFDSSRANNIPGTDIYLENHEVNRLENVWKVVNPCRNLTYLTSEIDLKVESFKNSIECDKNNANLDDIARRFVNIKFQSSGVCLGASTNSKYTMDLIHGANSVSLPSSVFNPILTMLIDNNILTNSLPAIVVEITSHDPLKAERVYAYCRNPDTSSDFNSVEMPFRLKAILNVINGDKVRIRLLTPSEPPQPPARALKITPIIEIPDDVADSSIIRKSLIESLNHQRIVYPGQVIFTYVPRSLDFGPIPFMICQTYDKCGVPTSVINVHGNGDGMELAIETLSNDSIGQENGCEAVKNYYKNLSKNRRMDEYVNPPTKEQVKLSIQKSFFTK